ncbi:MAG: glycosyltransferase family 4 protein [Prosthecobacter sp.]|uniref:glycosyltransferase family 4 protein n=1 Tax=Prosthecobacter sp. TaxID=1965333 RepID=UPI0025DAE174|nr:glycosyltransferase family 1 protein [Prosthecobacter sp.]MCF7787569.1 glycosyltransferase family 4 protein [Prosthecobacter sp.]
MRIGFNASLFCSPEIRGWTRYGLNLVNALHREGHDISLFAPLALHQEISSRLAPGIKIVPSQESRYWRWLSIELPSLLKRERIELFHTPHHFGLPFNAPCPTVVTIHDAIEMQERKVRLADLRQPRVLPNKMDHWLTEKVAHQVITVSQYSHDRIVEQRPHLRGRVQVIPNAADPLFSPAFSPLPPHILEQLHSAPYFFYVGGFEPRKNVPFLLKAFAESNIGNTRLVMAGGAASNGPALQAQLKELNLESRCLLLGRVDDAWLPGLYAGALAFVYPSLYEGFGLQICEAFAMGCPVIAADATSLPEVLGLGGESFNLDSTQQLSALMKRIASDESYRDQLKKRAVTRSVTFSWDETARLTARVYSNILSQN